MWDLTALDSFDLDESTGVVTADGGARLDALIDHLAPRGFFLPVTPGTKFVTVGGALAADVHGKNHHVDGSFANHVRSFRLLVPSGEVVSVEAGSDLFAATAGGMGLTGVILEVKFQALGVGAPGVVVDTERTDGFEETLASMTEKDHLYRYTVAWVDLLATGQALGRAIITRGDHLDRPLDDADWKPGRNGPVVPDVVPSIAINPLTQRVFNELWYRKAPRTRSGELQTYDKFFYPLDGVRQWNRIYGKTGFVQYQVALPFSATDTLRRLVADLGEARVGSFVVVLKRFGPGNRLLSFPIEGWTITVDVPAGHRGLGELLDDLDVAVTEAGGRTYFAKDARTDRRLVPTMYPQLDDWRGIVRGVDPDHLMTSDLDRRLGLKDW